MSFVEHFAVFNREHAALRINPNDQAEKTSMLTFGDRVRVVGEYKSESSHWSRVVSESGMDSWTETARLTRTSHTSFIDQDDLKSYVVPLAYGLMLQRLNPKGKETGTLIAPFCSRIPKPDDAGRFKIGKCEFQIAPGQEEVEMFQLGEDLSLSKKKRLIISALTIAEGATYEWGGTNTIGGFDCSGLGVAIFNKLLLQSADSFLPHTAGLQADRNSQLTELSDVDTGDFLFYGPKPEWQHYEIDHVAIVKERGEKGEVYATMAANGHVQTVRIAKDGFYRGSHGLKMHRIRRPDVLS